MFFVFYLTSLLLSGRRAGQPKYVKLPMNSTNTIRGFNQVMVPFAQRVQNRRPNQNLEYEGDNARAHTSHQFRNYLSTLQHPCTPFGGHPINTPGGRAPKSPDMCPIEYLFARWQEPVYQRNPRTVRQLVRVVEEEWRRIPLGLVESTILHMLSVMESIEANNGAELGYGT